MRYATYIRCSTEDLQSPEDSRRWQMERIRTLIGPDAEIVAEYFDVGQSRSHPWERRPEAQRLLADARRKDRTFDAIVVAEIARAFGDNVDQTLVMRELEFHGVELWHPGAGGPHDRHNIAHRMGAFFDAEKSEQERETIRGRVRDAMRSQAREGRWLGGRPPYGYRLVDAGAHPNPSKAAGGMRLHRLDTDPTTAPIVRRIFTEYIEGRGLGSIAENLVRDGIPSPSAADPERNRHRITTGGAWAKSAVRAILRNPVYTGRRYWGRQKRTDAPADPTNFARGYRSKLVWQDPSEWVQSPLVHEPIIDSELFARAQEHMRAGVNRPLAPRRANRTNTYVLRGLLRCGVCGRAMGGERHDARYLYRCRLPEQYALAKEIDHPRSVSVGELVVMDAVDGWLFRAFAPENVDETLAVLLTAQEPSAANDAKIAAAKKMLTDCDHRLEKLRAGLEHDGDPKLYAGWIAEVQGKRLAAERDLAESGPSHTFSERDLRELLAEVDVTDALRNADRIEKRTVYEGLGLDLSFDPTERVLHAHARGWAESCVGGAFATLNPPLTADLVLPKIRP